MTAFVIDACIAVKWFYEESSRDAAKKYLHSGLKRIAPDLIILEYVNAVRKKVVLKQLTQEEADIGFAIFMKRKNILFSTLYPANELMFTAYELSKKLNNHPIPDCLYLTLAERENACLVTADRKFNNHVMMSQFSHLIAWVEDPPEMK